MNVPPTPSAPPPHYAAATSSSHGPVASSSSIDDTFFDIVPQADETSFQVGYLGLDGFRAWIKGDVLIKKSSNDASYWQCSISLHAIESDQEQSITIFSESKILWSRDGPSTSQAASTLDTLPSTLPFSFSLTNDLPHCIHLPTSSLEYRLEATLRSNDSSIHPDAFRTTKVHLTRYSRPGPLQTLEDEDEDLSPFTWNVEDPCKMMVQLQKSLYRRADPITVYIRIPPPDHKVLSLSLRSVEANLLRIITAKGKDAKHELLLAHSGKLCRFNSMRAVILRLHLHPPFAMSNMPYPHPDHDTAQGGPIYGRGGGGGCESITQDTLLHDVRFLVRISIALRTDEGERRDVTLEREVKILPGAAGNEEDVESDEVQKRTVEKRQEKNGNGKAGEWQGEGSSFAGPSTSTSSQPLVIHDSEEEYDGYEDVGRSLSDNEDGQDSHHLLDEDGPPPTLLESQHDLQVEVEVEGVGAGVLRNIANEDPPSLPGDYVWRSDEIADQPPPADEDLLSPPPPLTPPPILTRNGEESIETVHPVSTQNQTVSDGSIHFPPPYMLASTNNASHQLSQRPSIGHTSNAHISAITRIANRETNNPIGQSTNSSLSPPPPPPLIPSEEGFPPAYTHPSTSPSFTSNQHPPSYEA